MGNLAKGSPLIKKLIFFVSYLTRAVFKGACENALNFGVNKEELIKIIEDTFEGGESID